MGTSSLGLPRTMRRFTIPSQDRNRNVPDFPDSDIRDEQTLSNTQPEDWLLPTEPLHGARPRQTGRERPPVIDNRPPIDDNGGAAVRKPGRTLLLSPGRRILMITPPRGGGGGRPAPEPHLGTQESSCKVSDQLDTRLNNDGLIQSMLIYHLKLKSAVSWKRLLGSHIWPTFPKMGTQESFCKVSDQLDTRLNNYGLISRHTSSINLCQ